MKNKNKLKNEIVYHIVCTVLLVCAYIFFIISQVMFDANIWLIVFISILDISCLVLEINLIIKNFIEMKE